MSSVLGFCLRTRLTRVARRATPPLLGYCLSFAGKGSICEWVSFVCRIVISVSPAAASKSGALIAGHIGPAGNGHAERCDAARTPPASEAFTNPRLVIMVLALPLLRKSPYREQNG